MNHKSASEFILLRNWASQTPCFEQFQTENTPSCLLWVFTTRTTAEKIVKAAIMIEDNAVIVWMVLQVGIPLKIDEEDVVRLLTVTDTHIKL